MKATSIMKISAAICFAAAVASSCAPTPNAYYRDVYKELRSYLEYSRALEENQNLVQWIKNADNLDVGQHPGTGRLGNTEL